MTLKQEHTEPFPTGSLGSTALKSLPSGVTWELVMKGNSCLSTHQLQKSLHFLYSTSALHLSLSPKAGTLF